METPYIDPYLFERQFEAFAAFVQRKSGLDFVSLASNPYVEQEEGYKYEVYRLGRKALSFQSWRQSDIGTGKIADAAISAIELDNNNLVPWQARYGDASRPHQPLFEAKNSQDDLVSVEKCLYRLYRHQDDEGSFETLVNVFGRRYPLVAYLFFLKDRSKYLPIAPRTFDRAFERLGSEFTTSHKCSWDNYSLFIHLVAQLKAMLAERLGSEVTLLDAHSFAWMLAAQMANEPVPEDVQRYEDLPSTEREAIVKARVGQGRFRNELIAYWSSGCAVTDCTEERLLRASHIKPWARSSLEERLNLYNGLLLTPALDACFDSGFISFDDDGTIIISNSLDARDAGALGIHREMRLKKVTPEHRKFLSFHRTNILLNFPLGHSTRR